MIRAVCALLLIPSAYSADFFTGQAARAVLGQSSFSSRDPGVAVASMGIFNNRLYVGDAAGSVLSFDLAGIPDRTEDFSTRANAACGLCGFSPVSTVPQAVAPDSTKVSVFGTALAAIDTRTHRVLFWNNMSLASSVNGPDVTFDTTDPETTAISNSTLIDPVSVALDGTHLFVGDAFLHRVLVWKTLPRQSNQPADLVLGQSDFSSAALTDTPRADTIARPDALVSDGINLYVGDSESRRILVFSPADSNLAQSQMVNAASMTPGAFAPGTLVTISGKTLADSSASAPDNSDAPLPSKLAGLEVIFDGTALPLLSVSPEEVRTQLKYSTGSATSSSLYLRLEHADGSITETAPIAVSLASASPGLFAFAGPEPRLGMLMHQDADSRSDSSAISADSPAAPGETITVWATGLHVLSPASLDQMPKAGVPFSGPDLSFSSIQATVNGQAADVASVVLPQTSIGIYQLRITLPVTLGTNATAQMFISQDGFNSRTVSFPVRKGSF